MASKAISDYRTEVQRYIKISGSGTNTDIDAKVIETLRDFCKFTSYWRETLDAISVVADTEEYTLTVPATEGDGQVHSLVWVKYKEDGEDDDQFIKLQLIDQDTIDFFYDDAGWKFETNETPDSAGLTFNKKLFLHPIPTEASTDGLLVRVVVIPTPSASNAPEFIFNDYYQTIAYGAAGLMMQMTNKPWTNVELGARYWADYLMRRNDIKFDRKTGNTNRRLGVFQRGGLYAGSRSRDSQY